MYIVQYILSTVCGLIFIISISAYYLSIITMYILTTRGVSRFVYDMGRYSTIIKPHTLYSYVCRVLFNTIYSVGHSLDSRV